MPVMIAAILRRRMAEPILHEAAERSAVMIGAGLRSPFSMPLAMQVRAVAGQADGDISVLLRQRLRAEARHQDLLVMLAASPSQDLEFVLRAIQFAHGFFRQIVIPFFSRLVDSVSNFHRIWECRTRWPLLQSSVSMGAIIGKWQPGRSECNYYKVV